MKTFRRAIASTIALLMILTSLLTVNVFAETVVFPDVAEDHAYKNAIYSLVEMGIINGIKDEATGVTNFKPEDTVTRAQFAKMLAIKLAGNVALTETTAQFRDLAQDHWANAYIAFAVKQGIINGVKDEATGLYDFKPEDPVKYGEAVKMLVCALGYGSLYSQLTPNEHWADGYIRVANQLELTKFAQSIAENPTPRGRVAQLIYNMDYCKKPDISTLGGGASGSGPNFKFDNTDEEFEETTGVVEAVFDETLTGQSMGLNKFQVIISGRIYNIGEISLDRFYPYLGKSVFIRYEEGSTYTIKSLEDGGTNSSITISPKNIADINGREIEYYESDNSNKTTKARLSNDLYVIYNGRGVPKADITDSFIETYFDVDVGEITLMNNNGGKDFEVAHVTSYTTYYVSGKSSSEDVYTISDSNNINGSTVVIDKDDCEDKVFKVTSVNGKKEKSALSSVVAKSVISVAEPYGTKSGTEVIISTVSKSNGTVDEMDGDNYIVISDTTYTYSDYFLTLRNNKPSEYSLSVGDKATFYFDHAGNLVTFTKSESTDPYAYVIGYSVEGTMSNKEHYIKLFAADKGKVAEPYPIKENVRIDGRTEDPDALEALLRENAAAINASWKNSNTDSSKDKYINDADGDDSETYSQLIRYKTSLSNGITFISEVYTVRTAVNPSGSIIPGEFKGDSTATADAFTDAKDKKLAYKNKAFLDNAGKNQFAINTKTIVIRVPDDRSSEEYSKLSSSSFSDTTSLYYAAEPYDIKSNNAAIVLYYANKSSTVSFNNYVFVESIRDTQNEDGETVQQLSYYASGSTSLSTILTEKYNTLAGVKGGDVIRFAKDGSELTDWKKLFVDGKLYDKGENEVMYFAEPNGSKTDYYQFIHGTVDGIAVDNTQITIEPIIYDNNEDYVANKGDWEQFTTNDSTKIYKWNDDNDKYDEISSDLGMLQSYGITENAKTASRIVALVVDGKVKSVYLLSTPEVTE